MLTHVVRACDRRICPPTFVPSTTIKIRQTKKKTMKPLTDIGIKQKDTSDHDHTGYGQEVDPPLRILHYSGVLSYVIVSGSHPRTH